MPEARNSDERAYVLGIDLGSRSIGFACVEVDGRGVRRGVLASGSRCFDAGVEGDVEKGKDQSRAAARRGPRQQRRQIWRRAWRRRKILRQLQRIGLLPEGTIDTPEDIHHYILGIDGALRSELIVPGNHRGEQTWLYALRTEALDERLEPAALGRALYHLAQRRGYKSNRKVTKDDEEEGKVAAGISALEEAMQSSGARTLGEYFSGLNPDEQRIRQRWTARAMYENEFDAIWKAQQRHHPDVLTDEFRRQLHHAMFHQRPLKSQAHLIGKCELIPGRRRAPMACMIAQRFRILAAVNNLLIRIPGEPEQRLSAEQRTGIIAALEAEGDLAFTKIRKRFSFPKHSKFNLEEGGEKKLSGNRTAAKLRPIFGDRWESMSDRQRDELINDLLSNEGEATVARLGVDKWDLDDAGAAKLALVRLEQDRARFCRAALHRLVGRMEGGTHYMTAQQAEFPESFSTSEVHDLLPPVIDVMPELRNPAVTRALTELRKVVNTLIRQYGKPWRVRVELARDLRNPRKVRKSIWEKNRDNQKERDAARERIREEMAQYRASRDDIEKVILANECNWQCPFTGHSFAMRDLIGPSANIDVAHIWPMSKTLDNTYANKTLSDADENRHEMRNRTAFEAYGGDEARWEAILERVKRFKGRLGDAKLRRFRAETLPEDFTLNQLADTRWASKKAAHFVGLLYGGINDEQGTKRVQVSAGGVTAFLRNEWGLNGILNDGGFKSRDDHRHHAVDAIAIALTEPRTVKMLADAAEDHWDAGRKRFATVDPPWEGFLEDVRSAIEKVNVSHRVNHRLQGQLHKDTNYSKAHSYVDKRGKAVEKRHVRKPVDQLSKNDVEAIVDPIVRARVEAKLAEVGADPKFYTKNLKDHWPALPTRDGREIPIKRVRVATAVTVAQVGRPSTPRFVAPGSNHHTVIVEVKDKKGRIKWEDHPVTRLEVMRRWRAGEPVVQRDWGPDEKFVMWFCTGDSVMLTGDDGCQQLHRCTTISYKDNWFRLHTDAMTLKDLREQGGRPVRAGGDKLRKFKARKVIVSPIGEVREVGMEEETKGPNV